MFKLSIFGLLLISLVNCKTNEGIKGDYYQSKIIRFLSPSKARVVELPVPNIISQQAPIQQRLVLEKGSDVQKDEFRLEQNQQQHENFKEKKNFESSSFSDYDKQNELNEYNKAFTDYKNEQKSNIFVDFEKQNFEDNIKNLQLVQKNQQELQEQKKMELKNYKKKDFNENEKIIQQSKNNEKIEQIVEQKQEETNSKLIAEEEAIAEPFPLIPKTNFTCDNKPILPGMYADLETGCRVYHFCFAKEKKEKLVQSQKVKEGLNDINLNTINEINSEQQQMKSFFCGEGTLFNQKLLICDYIANVICSDSSLYYFANSEFGKPSSEPVSSKILDKNNFKINEKIVQEHDKLIEQSLFKEPAQLIQQKEDLKQECVDCIKSIKKNNYSSFKTSPSNKFNQIKQIKSFGTNRRFLGEQMFNIPQTRFTCENKLFENGMYADIETGCRVYHQCFNKQKSTFLCAKGSLFNQKILSCDFESNVKCNESEEYYTANIEFN